jgi:hypothetical protein
VDAVIVPQTLALAPPVAQAPRRSVAELRAATGEWLLLLSQHLDETLTQALREVERRWEAFDGVSLVPARLRLRAAEVSEAWRAWVQREPQAANEALWTIASVLGLVAVLERRLAALVRAKVASGDSRLFVGPRPFLDVGLAVQEVARAWS